MISSSPEKKAIIWDNWLIVGYSSKFPKLIAALSRHFHFSLTCMFDKVKKLLRSYSGDLLLQYNIVCFQKYTAIKHPQADKIITTNLNDILPKPFCQC